MRYIDVFFFLFFVLLLSVCSTGLSVASGGAVDTTVHHYEYVLPDGWMYVYDIDNGHQLIDSLSLPTTAGARGVSFSPSDGMMYISYGGDGGFRGNGSMLQFSLLRDSIGWKRNYTHGVDSHDMSPDGKTIYMPDGELSGDGKWYVVNANDGSETGKIISTPGFGSHNTYVSRDGTRVYMGNRDPYSAGHNYLYVANTANDSIIQRVGPVLSGVRPFTVNGKGTIAYVTITGLLGFQACNITTGQVIATIDLTTMGFPKTPCITDGFPGNNCQTSHGISLSPDEKEVYVIDSPNSYVHVFDVSGIENNIAPVKIADIKLNHTFLSQATSCAYDCLRIGWLHHSLDGKYVYVGDCGDVIATATHSIVSFLPPLRNTRKMLEIDWQNGHPIATSTREGVGYVTAQGTPSVPTLLSPTNGIGDQPTTLTLTWNISSGATLYRVQLAADSVFTSVVFDDSTITQPSVEVSSLQNATKYFWRVRAKNSAGSSGWSTPVFHFLTGNVSVTVHLTARWNLLSLPLHVSDSRANVLFPGVLSQAYTYIPDFGYQAYDTLRNGIGYWLKFPAPQVITLSGTAFPHDTIPVLSGWNLIGSTSKPIAPIMITSNPPGMITGTFYGFTDGYIPADTLMPGFGYWVKVNQTGKLVLSASAMIASSAHIQIVPGIDRPPPHPENNGTASTRQIPAEFALEQNSPNPFNPTTIIRYQLPVESRVTLKIYNMLGQEVAMLADGIQDAGFKQVEFDAGRLSSGLYVYRLQAGLFTSVKKMLLMR